MTIMKLTKIKLINWHLFSDNSINVKGNFLLTGENGCGKSTLTDAIYFVLSGGDDNCFNNAANVDAKRTIKSYVRGKLGNEGEGKEFLRNSPDLICHIALQYEDEKTNDSMVLGCVIEIIDDGKPKIKFYVVQNYAICDSDYIIDGRIVNYLELKNILREKNAEFSDSKLNNTQKERRKTIARDILKLDNPEKYSELLRKAIAFKPINEVSTFVDDFLLKEDNIEIESLMEEIRSYREIKAQLDKEQEKVELLETFIDKAEKYYDNSKRIKFYAALRELLDIKEIEKEIKRQEKEYAKLSDAISICDQRINKLNGDKENYSLEKRSIENNELYKVLKEKKERRSDIRKKIDELSKKIIDIENIIAYENKISTKLGLKYRFLGDIRSENYILLKDHLREYREDLSNIKKENSENIAKLRIDIGEINQKISKKRKELEEINKGRNTYDERTTSLISALKKELFKKYQRDIEVRPLCEYIEIKDSRWTNAIEGYLNTQRFDLIIDPKYYDEALEIYENVKKELKIYGVGVVHCAKAEEYDSQENTLFNKLEISNSFARFAAHMLLGKVFCADSVSELKNYQTSITDSCMIYKNRTARNINPAIYAYPFVGRNSILKRKEILTSRIQEYNDLKNEKESQKAALEAENDLIESSRVTKIIEIDDIWKMNAECMNDYNAVQAEISKIEKDESIFAIDEALKDIEKKLEEITNILSAEEKTRNESLERRAVIENDIMKSKKTLEAKKEEYSVVSEKLDKIEYEKFVSIYIVEGKYDLKKVSDESQRVQNSNNAMKNEIERGMMEYVNRYAPSMSALIENVVDFVNEYNKLKERSLVDFKHKAQLAFERCQSGFKTDFLSKLSERIETARNTLKQINKNLRNNPFGVDDEIYQFESSSSDDDEMKDYYRIITSGKLIEVNTLFDEALDQRDKDILKRLFDRIILEKSGPDSEKLIKRYLDYRNYMKFDIKTTNKYGAVSYFSKTNKEKSGGETQTPFYVIIAACFDQLMKKGYAGMPTCTVIYDEAFNNMDESRISSLMEFYNKLDIQLCIVVPSSRMATLAEYMDTVVGLIKINNRISVQYIA